MVLKYRLYPNNLTDTVGDYTASIIQSGSIDLDRIAEKFIENGSTTKKSDMMAVLQELIIIIRDYVFDGFRVDVDGLGAFTVSMKGVFDTYSEPYDPANHTLKINMKVDQAIKDKLAKVVLEKIESDEPKPHVVNFRNHGDDQLNLTMSVGSMGTLIGHRLKYDQDAADEGVWIIDGSDPTEQIKVIEFSNNTSGKLVFNIPSPPVTSSEGYIEVRSRLGKPGGAIRKSTFDTKLTVA